MEEQQSKPHPLIAKVVRLRRRDPARIIHKLYQEDFEECLRLRALANEAEKTVKVKEQYIAKALRSGALVEPGIYTPELVRIDRKAYKVVSSSSYFRLDFKK